MARYIVKDISNALPIGAWLKGWMLLWKQEKVDPVYLHNGQGQIVYEWPYIPTLGEVDEICQRLLQGLT
jgi:hypothetical protein